MPKRSRHEPCLAGKKVAIFVDFSFEDLEVTYPKIRLEEEGAVVHVIGCHPAGTQYKGKHGYPIKSDACIDSVEDAASYAALILPGGFAPDYMRRNAKMLAMASEMLAAGRPLAAICHGPWMLCSARRKQARTHKHMPRTPTMRMDCSKAACSASLRTPLHGCCG